MNTTASVFGKETSGPPLRYRVTIEQKQRQIEELIRSVILFGGQVEALEDVALGEPQTKMGTYGPIVVQPKHRAIVIANFPARFAHWAENFAAAARGLGGTVEELNEREVRTNEKEDAA